MLEEYARHLLEGWHPVIVANRAPVEVHKQGTKFIATRGAGGLVSALSTLASRTHAVWGGGARTDADREVAQKHPRSPVSITGDDGRTYRIGFVTPDEETYDLYYNQISNPLLWFLQHYLWNLSHNPTIDRDTDHAWTEGYVKVNRLFADRVIQAARRGATDPNSSSKGRGKDRPLILIPAYQRSL